MTAHTYDLWGWYAGPAPEGAPRSTLDAPENTSQTTQPGALRANWSGFAWVSRPYELPAVEEHSPEVPTEVLRWQAVRALRLHDDPNAPQNAPGRSCLDTINAMRDAIPDENLRADVDDALLHVMTWRRASPTLAMMAASAGWSDAFVDQLFIAAAGYDL